MIMMKDLFIFLLFAFMRFATSNPDPCLTYEKLTDNTRSTDRDLPSGAITEVSDRLIKDSWYLLRNPGSTDMPTSCVAMFKCESTFPIWLNGTLPTVKDQVRQLSACKSGFLSCCESSFPIEVKNCGSFNVYHLTPLSTNSGRYCMMPGSVKCRPGTSSESGYEPCHPSITFNISPRIYPDIMSHTDESKRFLRFRCLGTSYSYSRYSFDVKYLLNGTDINCTTKKNLLYSRLSTDGAFNKLDWRCTSKKIGFKIKCMIRARQGLRFSEWKESPEYFAGLKIRTPHVTVNAGRSASVSIQSTIPIACKEHPVRGKLPCKVTFEMLDLTAEKDKHTVTNICSHGSSSVPSTCGFEFDGWRWNNVQYMRISTLNNPLQPAVLESEVHIKAVNNVYDPMWNAYEPGNIKMTIKKSNIAFGRCMSNEDPNIHTSDGKLFWQHDQGEFILYEHKTKPIAVHAIHNRRSDVSHAGIGRTLPFTANCGVAVRAASDVFIVYGCGNPPTWKIKRLNCDRSRGAYLDIYERNNGQEYEIHLPTGTEVKIKLFRSQHYLDIYISPISTEIGNSHGLCGHYNRNSYDDFKDKNGRSVSAEAFKHIWSVQLADSLFLSKSRNDVMRRPYFLYCSCTNVSRINRTFEKEAECFWKESRNMCPGKGWRPNICRIKHKRSLSDHVDDDDDDDDEFDIPPEVIAYKPAPENIGQWKNGWNETSARSHCFNVLHKSKSFQNCNGRVHGLNDEVAVGICINDIKISGTTRFSTQSTTAYSAQCTQKVRTNVSLWEQKTNGRSLAEEILNNDCPNDCSSDTKKQGNCVDGECRCFPGYSGDDCSVKDNEPPIIVGSYADFRCDLYKQKCINIPIFAENIIQSNSLKCKIDEINVNGGLTANGNTHIISAKLENFNEVKCSISALRKRGRRSISVTKTVAYNISVTTNGNLYSQPISVVLYDSSCVDCKFANGLILCKERNKICGSHHTNDRKQNQGPGHFWIIGAVLGGLSLMAVIIFIIVKTKGHERAQTHVSMADLSNERVVYCLPPKSTEYKR